MSNQVILWAMIIVPWLTLFLMDTRNVKRLIPAALFTSLTSMIIVEVGITLNWWVIQESAYPLRSLPYHLGLSPVLTMWLLYATYGYLLKYLAIDILLNFGFVYGLIGFLSSRGIEQLTGISPFQTAIVAILHGILIYGFQMWQEGIFVQSEKVTDAARLQPAAAKPLPKDQEDNTDNK